MNLFSVFGSFLNSWVALVLALFAVFFGGTGCNALQPNAFPKEIGQAARTFVDSAANQAVWSNLTAHVRGQAIEPGLQGYAGVLYIFGGKITGFSGQLGFEGEGTGRGTPTTPEELKATEDAVSQPDLADQLIDAEAKKH